MTNTEVIELDDILDQVRDYGRLLPEAAIALSRWVANYLELVIADLDRQIQADDALVDMMAKNCPSKR